MFVSQNKITEQLIRNQGEEPAKTIKLSLRSMKLTKIENLDQLVLLQELNLSHNNITKIENLRLPALKELNLSDNFIKSMHGLEFLPSLINLNLNGNQITEINLTNHTIETLKISRNQIKDPIQLLNLKPLLNLKILSISDNPFCRTFSYIEYLCFLTPTLQVLDNKVISNQHEIAKQLYGEPIPSDHQQLLQNIRLVQLKKQEIDTEIAQIENKMQRATNLLQTYQNDSDSEDETDRQLTNKAFLSLKSQLEEHYQVRQETDDALKALKQQLESYKQQPKEKLPTEQLNRINSLFVRLQAVLQIDLTSCQRTLFEMALQGSIEQVLQSIVDLLETILDRIPLLPQESVLQEVAAQVHDQIQELYQRVSTNSLNSIGIQDKPIESSIVLLKKLFKRAEKKYKKIDEFYAIKAQFIKDFEIETQQLAEKWKDYENKKTQLLQEKETISKELEEQFEQIMQQKEELKMQHQQVEVQFAKSNEDFKVFRAKQNEARKCLTDEITRLGRQQEQLSEEVQELQSEMERLKDTNAEKEESIRLLNEEIEMLQQRIQDQYQVSFQIREDQQRALNNIEYLNSQKELLSKDIEELQFEHSKQEQDTMDLQIKYQNENKKMKQLLEELDTCHQKLKSTEQLCKEADRVLKQLNNAIADKEQEMQKYDKIMQESNIEKEKIKQTKNENMMIKKETQKLRTEFDNLEYQVQVSQDNLLKGKKNLQQVTQLTIEKEQELLQIEKQLINTEKQIQDQMKQKDILGNDFDILQKELKKLNIEKAKLQQQVDDATIDLQSLKQEYQIQQSNLQSLNKQIELKVTELSTQTHYQMHQGQESIINFQLQLQKLQESIEIKGQEFKLLVDQIDQLQQKRDHLIQNVQQLQSSVLQEEQNTNQKPYIVHDEESLHSQSYDKLKPDWLKPTKNSAIKSQTNFGLLSDFSKKFQPRSANQSLLRKSPQGKDQSVQSVIQNLEELNQNLDRMYMESLERFES
ncbi:unnamed protein product [Paramecium sonneborni]|uniref:Uncharacterized protein n=1 Tax=Paramecium sonneborni TaxID=65129 RepID=A0A8S1JXW8_9CILI|nr:unnamed protein product [Paramecium sonneborni]